jgi:hypothetical protein
MKFWDSDLGNPVRLDDTDQIERWAAAHLFLACFLLAEHVQYMDDHILTCQGVLPTLGNRSNTLSYRTDVVDYIVPSLSQAFGLRRRVIYRGQLS